MICFRDKTFCSADCVNTDCHRNFTLDQKAAAERWWGRPGAPVAFANFSEGCADFQPRAPKDDRDKALEAPNPSSQPLNQGAGE